MNTIIYARIQGILYDVLVKEGQRVNTGDAMFVVEASKAQLAVNAPYDGTVQRIARKPGDTVSAEDVVLELDTEKSPG
jgi:urea carboxylase